MTIKIPFLDLKDQYRELEKEIVPKVRSVLKSGWYILGKECEKFENSLSSYLGGGHAIGCNSGTDAISLSLICAGVRPGDEVITVANTAIPTVSAICSTGAIPVFTEVDKDTWLMDPNGLNKSITKKTRAIVPVHLYGNVCDMPAINRIAKARGLKVVEDNAQALGASLNGRMAGTMGDFGAFSFYPTKNIGAMGDAGAIYCKSVSTAKKIRMLRNYGQRDRYNADIKGGLNSRLDEIHAATLGIKLRRLDSWNEKKAFLYDYYKSTLPCLPVKFQAITKGASPAWHLLVIKLRDNKTRKAFMGHMLDAGVQTLIHYPNVIYMQRAFKEFFKTRLPITEQLCNSVVSLPLHPYLIKRDIQYISGQAALFFG